MEKRIIVLAAGRSPSALLALLQGLSSGALVAVSEESFAWREPEPVELTPEMLKTLVLQKKPAKGLSEASHVPWSFSSKHAKKPNLLKKQNVPSKPWIPPRRLPR